MEKNESEKIISKLKQLPDLEPPSHLVNAVMHKVTKRQSGWLRNVYLFLTTPHPVSFRPVTYALSICVLLVLGHLVPFPLSNGPTSSTTLGTNEMLATSSEDSEASFLLGRGLMAAGLVKEAIPLLQKASLNAPDNPYYAFWAGLCFAANNMPEKERSSYRKAVEISPDNTTFLLNIGHSFLEERNYPDALNYYNQTLSIDSNEQTALYNRALIFHLQEKKEAEQAAWKTYLAHYSYGVKAFRAVQHLNNLNDYTYRTYYIGKLKIILNQKELLNFDPEVTLTYNKERLLRYLRQNPSITLDIITYRKDNVVGSKENAVQLKKHLVSQLGPSLQQQIRLSWFGEAERVEAQTGSNQLLQSVLIFASNSQPLQEIKI
ncbi:tetratricopeptide repeat protein [Desulforhopalus sp. 52FAK]